jgi:hypothetical protein
MRAKVKESLNKIIDAAVGNNMKALVKKYRCIIPHSNDGNLSNVCLIAPGRKHISIYINYLGRWNQLIMKGERILDWPFRSFLLQIQVYADAMELKKRNRINNIDNLDLAGSLQEIR